ncbi:uncharacterized protein HMPREF1541_10813 [Cyphellophora europaea CBS 101466]|uniref:YAG7-like dimerisation domain-containing protein n=1 Tax=Cyphellophora europaea (strain CBS 101466) TaxID=1220924 RepID=W2S6E5_CYPE1|nr:uncharacterized protein HMPREF1541_10813 [Cyphellophora europaea CBS 101466]ETN44262.1 hypothetical protein HMPREF1541_10813 [Cyphellophora europaea CBS 101466]
MASVDSKNAKKRKAKVDVVASTETASQASDPTPAASSNGIDSVESPYIRELSKQIRNLNKKLSASAKADSVLAENPGKTIDELVASRKLNADQKNQLEKKPALRAQLVQLEEQVTQYRSFSQELEERFNREKSSLIESHEAEIAQLKEEAANNAKAAESSNLEESLKIITHFLHAAASKRQSEDPDSDEARAFEGALLLVYQGNESSLSTLRNLIQGSEDKITDTQGELVDYTYAQIKHAALSEVEAVEGESADGPSSHEASADTDPTIANAGLTELQDTTTIPIRTNGAGETEPASAGPEQASTADSAANAIAESKWDPEASVHTEVSAAGEDWVNVPRDPAETDTGLQATPAAPAAQVENSNSWADEMDHNPPPVPENDGFEQVKGRHSEHRGRGRGRGGQQRGDFRGRGRGGQRGDFRGRGRPGEGRGRGGHRGERS